VGHHGDPDVHEPVDEVQLGALDLHRVRTALLHEPAGVADAVLDRHLVGQERHVPDDHRPFHAPGDGLRVMQHLLHRDRERVRVAQDVVRDRVADEEDRDAGLVEDPRGGEVVGGEHREAGAPRLPGLQVVDRDHRSRLLGKCTAVGPSVAAARVGGGC
jgi:hypothetical protein